MVRVIASGSLTKTIGRGLHVLAVEPAPELVQRQAACLPSASHSAISTAAIAITAARLW